MKGLTVLIVVLSIPFFAFINQDKHKIIIEKWSIGSTTFKGNTAYCNSCPQIEFKADGTAKLIYPSQDLAYYSWSARKNQMTLILDSATTRSPYFSEFNYSFKIKQESQFYKLSIVNDANGYTYNLGRSK